MKTYLDKAEAYAKEKNIDPSILVASRLAPDMLPLSGQYQRASDTAKFALARLTATDAPNFEDNETTFPSSRARSRISSPTRSMRSSSTLSIP
ncbi:DUF1993 family protein, partial [Rhizobium ruizarguesonis]